MVNPLQINQKHFVYLRHFLCCQRGWLLSLMHQNHRYLTLLSPIILPIFVWSWEDSGNWALCSVDFHDYSSYFDTTNFFRFLVNIWTIAMKYLCKSALHINLVDLRFWENRLSLNRSQLQKSLFNCC